MLINNNNNDNNNHYDDDNKKDYLYPLQMNCILDYPFLETGLLSPPCFVLCTLHSSQNQQNLRKSAICTGMYRSVLEVQDIHYLAFSRTKCKRDLKF